MAILPAPVVAIGRALLKLAITKTMTAAPIIDKPTLEALIEKGLFDRLPVTFGTFFFDQVKAWDLLFPAEQSYFERLFGLLDRTEPKLVEEKWYAFWKEGGYFHAEPDPSRTPYCITIPPPNITGSLHIGHALNNSILDAMTRWYAEHVKKLAAD